jgi:hypothetical protein
MDLTSLADPMARRNYAVSKKKQFQFCDKFQCPLAHFSKVKSSRSSLGDPDPDGGAISGYPDVF